MEGGFNMGYKPEDIDIELGGQNENNRGKKHLPQNRKWKIKIGTRDIALIMVFILIIIGLLIRQIDIKWAISILGAIASGGIVSQVLHNKKKQ